MSRYQYGDQILDAFMIFRQALTLEDVIAYVAEIVNKTPTEVRLDVDNTLTAAWMHGFLKLDRNLYSLMPVIWEREDPMQDKWDKRGYVKLLLNAQRQRPRKR